MLIPQKDHMLRPACTQSSSPETAHFIVWGRVQKEESGTSSNYHQYVQKWNTRSQVTTVFLNRLLQTLYDPLLLSLLMLHNSLTDSTHRANWPMNVGVCFITDNLIRNFSVDDITYNWKVPEEERHDSAVKRNRESLTAEIKLWEGYLQKVRLKMIKYCTLKTIY